MKKKIYIFLISIMIILLSTIINVNANQYNIESKIIKNNLNKQIYLGSASIVGYGNDSDLSAELENDLLIKLNSSSSVVDFYIDYDITCNGLTDQGVITLTIFLNDQNVSFNFVQSSANKSGSLKVENVEIKNRDALTFRINVVYGSVIPFYSDSISDTGFGIVNKGIILNNNIFKILNYNILNLLNKIL
jgi:hypothetical protein